MKRCPNTSTHLSIQNGEPDSAKTPSRDDYRSGYVKIKAGAFPVGTSWRIAIASRMSHSCMIDIIVQPKGIENIPLHIHSDVGPTGLMNMSEDHSFSCDVDYVSKDPTVQLLLEKQIKYQVILSELRSGRVPRNGKINQHKNAIKAPRSFFEA